MLFALRTLLSEALQNLAGLQVLLQHGDWKWEEGGGGDKCIV